MTIFRVVETGSTNTDMLARAATGTAQEGDWLIAERQTAGRGRQGRAWQSPPGNFYASGLVALSPGDPPAPTLALVAGIAVVDVLDGCGLRLKWPNDVMADDAKLGGILLERQGDWVVVGVGLNLAHVPDLPDRRVTSLKTLGYDVDVAGMMDVLWWNFAHRLADWREHGVAATCAAWMERAHPVGTAISAALPDGTRIHGQFAGLTGQGALILSLADGGTRVIHAGDVFLI